MRQPGCQAGSVMSRRNLSEDEKGHLKHKKAVRGLWGQIQTNPGFPWRIKNLRLFFLCLFWLLAGGERNSPAVYFLAIKGGWEAGR